MKLIYLAPCRTKFPSMSASSIHMIRMCEAFAELGHQIEIFISDGEGTATAIKEFYGISSEIEICRIPVPKGKLGNIFYALKATLLAKKRNPDYILGRSVTACSLSCMSGLKTILDSHGPIWESNIVDRILFRAILRNPNFIRMTVNSISLKNMYEEIGLNPRCGIEVAFNGSKEFDGREPPQELPGRNLAKKIGYFGGLYPGRGIEVILNCATALPDHDFHIFGGSTCEIEELKKNGIPENTFFHGFVKPDFVASYRNKCDILLAPYSRTGVAVSGGKGDSSSYMNPIKIIEYMSSGKAIVCSDIPVLREVLGENGAVFANPEKPNDWISAIKNLGNDETYTIYAKRAIERFERGLSWKSRAKKLLGEYEECEN